MEDFRKILWHFEINLHELQTVIEEAFLPTLSTFMRAPADSPLQSVKINAVGDFFAGISNPHVRRIILSVSFEYTVQLLICMP